MDLYVGDTIISKKGNRYEASNPLITIVWGVSVNDPDDGRWFEIADLTCTDEEEGIWQEASEGEGKG